MIMDEQNIKDILNNIPDLTYKAKKRKLEDYEFPLEKEELDKSKNDVAVETLSNADIVYNNLDELAILGQEAEDVIDDICKDIVYDVIQEDEPVVYAALQRLFGDDFTGQMTWKMYSQLLEIKSMISEDFTNEAI